MSYTIDIGQLKDLQDIEVFVAASVYPAFDHPDLTDDQRAENERIVQISRAACEVPSRLKGAVFSWRAVPKANWRALSSSMKRTRNCLRSTG